MESFTPEQRLHSVGLILGAISGVCYAFHGLFIRLLTNSVSPMMITLIRSAVIMIIGILILIIDYRNVKRINVRDVSLLIGAGVTSMLLEFTMSSSLQMISLSDSLTIFSSSPVFASIIGSVINRKIPTIKELVIILVTVVGVVFCVQPDFIFNKSGTTGKKIGYIYAIVSSFMVASICHLNGLVKHVHVGINCSLVLLTATSLSMSYMIVTGTFVFPTAGKHIIYVIGMTFFGASASFTRYYGVKLGDATMTSVGRSSDIVVSLFLEILIFHNIPNVLSVGGACLIILAITMPVAVTNPVILTRQ
ncbi:Uncharacterised protein at_DN0008 [Pycnogonum litorale]